MRGRGKEKNKRNIKNKVEGGAGVLVASDVWRKREVGHGIAFGLRNGDGGRGGGMGQGEARGKGKGSRRSCGKEGGCHAGRRWCLHFLLFLFYSLLPAAACL